MYGFDVYNANKIMMTTWYDNSGNNLSMDVASDKRWRNFDDMGNEIRYNPEALAKFNENATMWNPTSCLLYTSVLFEPSPFFTPFLLNLTLCFSSIFSNLHS